MSSRSASAPVEGTLRSHSASLVFRLAVAWSLVGALGFLPPLLILRTQVPGVASEWWAAHTPADQVSLLLQCGVYGWCAWLLLRHNQLAVWPTAALAAWRVGVFAWQGLHGTLAVSSVPGVHWIGVATTPLALVAIVWLRDRRVLR